MSHRVKSIYIACGRVLMVNKCVRLGEVESHKRPGEGSRGQKSLEG
jgi:hypothetical protein